MRYINFFRAKGFYGEKNFTNKVAGRAEEAMQFYLSIFNNNSKQGIIARYGNNMAPDKEGSIMFADFSLAGQWFAVMDSAREHAFDFNEAISLLIPCETQDETRVTQAFLKMKKYDIVALQRTHAET